LKESIGLVLLSISSIEVKKKKKTQQQLSAIPAKFFLERLFSWSFLRELFVELFFVANFLSALIH